MSVIEQEIELEGSKGSKKVLALFDSGATYSHIKPDVAEKLEIVTPLPQPMEFEMAEQGAKIIADKRVTLNFWIDGYRFSDEFMILPNLAEEVIIGAKTMQAWRMKLDFETEKVIFDHKVTRLRLI